MSDVTKSAFNPGSDEAVKAGCKCPVLDNAHGKGYMGGVKDDEGDTVFVLNLDCELHKVRGDDA